MKNKRVSVDKLIVVLIVVLFLPLAGCTNTNITDAVGEIGTYVINTRSKRIHSEDCQYVSQMSEKNKRSVKKSIVELLKNDYVICRKCRAGIKKPMMEDMVDRLFYPNLYIEDITIEATYDEYLSAINEMGEWYVNHIPTYASKLQEESFENYKGELKNYNTYELKNKDSLDQYYVLSENRLANSTDVFTKDTSILRANENAVMYYLNKYDDIEFDNKIAYYPCEILDTKNDYCKPGDDCVRFLFAALNKMDSHFTQKFHDLTLKSYKKTNSTMLTEDDASIAFGMINLGFKIYDVNEQPITVGMGNTIEGYISRIDDNFKLRKGDVIAQNGHVHIYLGDGVATESPNFGWGKVNREYPQIYAIEVKKLEDGYNYVVLKNNQGEESYYSRVYRYVGNIEGE